MVAGEQAPRPGKALHGKKEATHSAISYGLRIEHVAGHHNQIHALLRGQGGDALDGGGAGFGKHGGVIRLKEGVGSADLPVGRV